MDLHEKILFDGETDGEQNVNERDDETGNEYQRPSSGALDDKNRHDRGQHIYDASTHDGVSNLILFDSWRQNNM